LAPDEATGECYVDIQSQYSAFNLDDKVIINGGVMIPAKEENQ